MIRQKLLTERIEVRVEAFSLRALRHNKHHKLFPRNIIESDREVRDREVFKVNRARTNMY